MRDIDELMEGLRAAAPDPRLERMDDAVMAGVANRRVRRAARRSLVLTSIAALGIGLAAGVAPSQEARAEGVAMLNAVPDSAPSSLLMGTR